MKRALWYFFVTAKAGAMLRSAIFLFFSTELHMELATLTLDLRYVVRGIILAGEAHARWCDSWVTFTV